MLSLSQCYHKATKHHISTSLVGLLGVSCLGFLCSSRAKDLSGNLF